MRSDKLFEQHVTRALNNLGPMRTLELLGDKFLEMARAEPMEERFKKAYTDAVDDIIAAMGRFEKVRGWNA